MVFFSFVSTVMLLESVPKTLWLQNLPEMCINYMC